MVQTRAQNTSVTDPPVQSTRNVPLTRRRAATDEPAERAAPSTMKGKGKEKAISILSDVSSDDEDDEPEEEVDLPKRNEPIARFHARGLVKSISPPRSESGGSPPSFLPRDGDSKPSHELQIADNRDRAGLSKPFCNPGVCQRGVLPSIE